MSTEISKKAILHQFSDKATLHGFRYLVEERGLKWVMWFIVVLSSFILCVYLSRNMFHDYIERNHYTVLSINYINNEVEFPTVTICLLNSISLPKLMKYASSDKAAGFDKNDFEIFKRFYVNIPGDDIGTPEWDKTSTTFSEFLQSNFSSTSDFLNAVQINYDDMFSEKVQAFSKNSSCLFNQTKCERCNFKRTVRWPNNLCYQFNSFMQNKPPLKLNKAGAMKNGLKMYLDLHSADTSSEKPFQGVDVFIHPYGTNHFLSEYTTHSYLSPGVMNMILLEQRKVTLLEAPYSTKCGEAKMSILSHMPYSKPSCVVDCFLQMAYKKCGCIGFEFEKIINDSFVICDVTTNLSSSNCYAWFMAESYEKRVECTKKCPLECTQTKFNVKISQASLGSDLSYKKLEKHMCMEEENYVSSDGAQKQRSEYCRMNTINVVRDSLIGITVGFDTLISTTETLTPSATISNLLGTVGGSIGLCLGFSLITAFEFIMLLVDLCQAFFVKNQVHEDNQQIQINSYT